MTETKYDKSALMGITELSKKYHVTRQAIFNAIKKKHLDAQRVGKLWKIWEVDYEEYRAKKYSREKSTFNGLALYRSNERELSIRQCAKLFGVHEQRIYYLVHKGAIPTERRGNAIILRYEDCMKVFQEEENQLRFA